eukprot:Platyproteum_vivax@DN3323_c0_g1_i2.p1
MTKIVYIVLLSLAVVVFGRRLPKKDWTPGGKEQKGRKVKKNTTDPSKLDYEGPTLPDPEPQQPGSWYLPDQPVCAPKDPEEEDGEAILTKYYDRLELVGKLARERENLLGKDAVSGLYGPLHFAMMGAVELRHKIIANNILSLSPEYQLKKDTDRFETSAEGALDLNELDEAKNTLGNVLPSMQNSPFPLPKTRNERLLQRQAVKRAKKKKKKKKKSTLRI